MRWCSLVLVPRAVWLRPLSVDKCSSLMTCAAVPQMHRTRRQVPRWSVGHDAPPAGALWQAPARPVPNDGPGHLRDPRLA
jgi:hypothetical protein